MPENESKYNELLDLDDLDEVAGGHIFAADSAYEVIDNQGNVVERFGCDPDDTPSVFEARRRAKAAARNRGLSDSEIPGRCSGPCASSGQASDDVPADLSSLKREIGLGAVVCMASDAYPLGRRAWCFPVWAI